MVIGQQKGRSTKENILRSFGMPRPEGYRKALRLMKLAERFGGRDRVHRHPGRPIRNRRKERGQAEATSRSAWRRWQRSKSR